MSADGELSGRTIVITGASSGFGKGAARAFANEGASLVLAARRAELLEELASACRSRGVTAVAVPTDVSVREDVERLARTALDETGRIDVWINDAGVGAIGFFEVVPLALHAQVIATNLLGTVHGSWVAIRHFLERGDGTLINVASELGKHSVPHYASYVASKHGVVALGASLRQELEQRGIRDVHVCTVLPTAHDTPFFDHVANYSGHEIATPFPLHDPQDVVDTLVRLARDPRDEEIVGGDGIAKVLLRKIAPGIEESVAGKLMHRWQMEQPPPAPPTPGAVAAPIAAGVELHGGRA